MRAAPAPMGERRFPRPYRVHLMGVLTWVSHGYSGLAGPESRRLRRYSFLSKAGFRLDRKFSHQRWLFLALGELTNSEWNYFCWKLRCARSAWDRELALSATIEESIFDGSQYSDSITEYSSSAMSSGRSTPLGNSALAAMGFSSEYVLRAPSTRSEYYSSIGREYYGLNPYIHLDVAAFNRLIEGPDDLASEPRQWAWRLAKPSEAVSLMEYLDIPPLSGTAPITPEKLRETLSQSFEAEGLGLQPTWVAYCAKHGEDFRSDCARCRAALRNFARYGLAGEWRPMGYVIPPSSMVPWFNHHETLLE